MKQQESSAIEHAALERELHISIWRDYWAQFEGCAAQLIAEGLIPDNFKWPHASDSEYWEVNGFEYWLRRTRPEGHKGPQKSWLGIDNWVVRVTVSGRDYNWSRRRDLERRAEELRAELYGRPVEGLQKLETNFARYLEAHRDKSFQAFKSLIPALVSRKRGRKPKTSTQQTKAS